MFFNVIFRTCDAVHSVHHVARPFGLDKRTLIQICFLSLYDSIKDYPHHIHVLGDKLSDELQEFFRRFPNVEMTLGDFGNDESIRQSIRIALGFPEDSWVYFCEDDYLHVPHAFARISEFISDRGNILAYSHHANNWMKFLVGRLDRKSLFIHPPDYPDRYQDKYRRFSFVFLSRQCHWRQITDTTFTFMAEVSAIRKYERVLNRASIKADDRYLSRRLFGRIFFIRRGLCVSPMPGLATHMHEGVMTPLVDWEKVVVECRLKI